MISFTITNDYDQGVNVVYLSSFEYIDQLSWKVTSTNIFEDYIAEQGFLYVDDGYNNCTLSAMTKEKPFELKDESQIVHLRNSYIYQARTKTCFWQFSAPKGYGFKIFIQKFEGFATTLLRIKNSTDYITK